MVQIEPKEYPAIGSYVDVGTYQAHYYAKGEGDVAFVFITGSGTPCAYTDFYMIQNMLSTMGQTVTFDHAGSGWSSSTETERSIENLVKELSILIDTVAPNKPIILLCHSLGSLEAIGYAQMNPEKVKGIIFLDSGSPEFYSTDSEIFAKIINRGSAFIRTIGINRLLGELGIMLPLYGENIRNHNIPEEVKEIDKSMYYQFTGNSASLDNIKLINENAKKVREGSLLGKIPILVLSSDNGDEWNDVQIQLASWSENSKQVMIKNAEHYIHWSNYDKVSYYIELFVEDILN
ncbi:alpha/beta fold hydrolase [Roseburia sp. 499]|uniref:alpha/beta fold hydrolase n=1 Tax=Roseburia sp. 499 TaxID=1261634 RepID=UPI000952455E|nr:alpha/beta hydrolase [Roseburia sp. 499]WVK71325.1 alpha/beta hydrolase [Roseburia sp. 499]